ncbi:MAG: GNAT family N-acetyltransferase [Candidatus Coatesbacteria bacterium]|nr:GNAT family N-acetyltransferase [Candidatus Coatesbacteria bacterium]
MINISCRVLLKEDLDDIYEVWFKSGIELKKKGRDSRKNLMRQMDLPNTRFIGAFNDEKMLGVVLATHDGRKGWINRISTLPEFQKHGIALRLIDEAEEWLKKENIEVFSALIYEDNMPSIALFEKANYKYIKNIHYFVKKVFEEV